MNYNKPCLTHGLLAASRTRRRGGGTPATTAELLRMEQGPSEAALPCAAWAVALPLGEWGPTEAAPLRAAGEAALLFMAKAFPLGERGPTGAASSRAAWAAVLLFSATATAPSCAAWTTARRRVHGPGGEERARYPRGCRLRATPEGEARSAHGTHEGAGPREGRYYHGSPARRRSSLGGSGQGKASDHQGHTGIVVVPSHDTRIEVWLWQWIIVRKGQRSLSSP